LRELDRLERQGPDAVLAALERAGISPEPARRLVSLAGTGLRSGHDAHSLLDELEGNEGVAEMREVLELISDWGVPEHRFGLDLSIARGLDYYTGTVYETTLVAHPEIGSICSGGRYDNLASEYTKSRLPGVGISIGLSRLFWQLREAGLLENAKHTVQVLVGLLDDAGLHESLGLAADLRQAGINTESILIADRIGNQLKHADRGGIDWYVVAGPDERARGEVMVRNLRTGHQSAVGRQSVVAAVRDQ
jgi:histidyl-tRNA synthetase